MRYALLGCGRIGIAAGLALAARSETRVLTLIDLDPHSARGLASRLSGAHAELRSCTVQEGDPASLRRALEGADALAVAAPWRAVRETLEVAKSLRLPLVGVARPPRRPPLPPSRRAGHALPPVLLACGLQPGLTEILALAAVASLPGATRLEIRCGRLPDGPGGYSQAAWCGEQPALSDRSAFAIRDGLACVVRRFSDVEPVEVDGLGTVEAFHDGMLPWLAEDPRLARVGEVTHKALAPPGFAAAARALQDGASHDRPSGASPVSAPAVEQEVTVLQVRATVAGTGERAELSLLERGDPAQGLGSLARTAGFTLACATAMLAEGSIAGHGWLQPEQVFTGPALELLLAELALLGVAVRASRSGPS